MWSTTFRAMGTDVHVIAPHPTPGMPEAGRSVEELFAREERRFSRFLPTSELSGLNASAGHWVRCSPEMIEVVGLALWWADRTDGLFDPTVLRALEAAGYDRSFDEVTDGRRSEPAAPAGGWRDIEMEGGAIRLPEGVGLDLGGLAKGWSVDRAVETLTPEPWVIVNAGGDLRVAGAAPPGGLEVAIDDPFDLGGELLRVRVAAGALATSTVARRTWGPGLHHVIDPRTGLPLRSAVVQATVWADTTATAEVLAKWTLFHGADALQAVQGVVVHENGEVLVGLAGTEVAA